MSKEIEQETLEVTEDIENISEEIVIEERPINYNALGYTGWFRSDAKEAHSWFMQVFNSNLPSSNDRLKNLVAAAKSSLVELEDDIVNLRAFLAEYEDDGQSES